MHASPLRISASSPSASQSEHAPRLLLVILGHINPQLAGRHGDYEQLYLSGLRASAPQLRHDVLPLVDQPDAKLPRVTDYDGVVISGGAACVTDGAAWLEPTVRLVHAALERETPLLGVCLGHQVLAHAIGATVGPSEYGWSFGTTTVSLNELAANDPLLCGLPSQFDAHISHRQAVLQLADRLVTLGSAAPHPCYIIRVGRCAWGIQFHPEFTVPFMRDLLDRRRQIIDEANGPGASDHCEASLRNAPLAPAILERFAALCASRKPQATPTA